MARRNNRAVIPLRRDSGVVGLAWAAKHAKSPIMREFACVALRAGFTEGDIARRLRVRDGSAITTRNVSVHFDSKTPRLATIRAYAEVLSITKAHLTALGVPPLDAVILSEGWQRAWRTLLLRAYEFQDGTVERIAAWIQDVTAAQRGAIGAAVILAEERERHGLVDPVALQRPDFAQRFGQPFAAFATALLPDVDLFNATRGPADSRLVRAWIELGWSFQGDAVGDRDHVIDFIVRLLRGRGVDTTAMEATLARAKIYFEEGLKIPVPSIALALEPLIGKEKERSL